MSVKMDKTSFNQLVQEAYEGLPEAFLQACKGVVVRTADFAEQDVLESLGIDNPYGLLGLYHGINNMQKSVFDLPRNPNMVFLYRKPVLAFTKDNDLDLEEVVTHVVVHEIGHHMGFSDDDMEAIEYSRDGFYHASPS